jgi:hypothetical protein
MTDEGGGEGAGLLDTEASLNRKQAVLAVLPFLALGIGDIVLLLFWGLDPLWGFMILPPILFISVLAWIGFRSGFIADRADGTNDTDGLSSDADRTDLDSDGEREDVLRPSDYESDIDST